MTYYYTNCRTQVSKEVDEMGEILLIKETSKTMKQAFEKEYKRVEKNKTMLNDGFLFWQGKKLLGLYMLGNNKWKKAKFEELNSETLSGFYRTVFPYHDANDFSKWENSWKDNMAKEEFTMWFQDGRNRTSIWGKIELHKLAIQYNFNAYEVLNFGETKMLDDDGEVIGGVVQEI